MHPVGTLPAGGICADQARPLPRLAPPQVGHMGAWFTALLTAELGGEVVGRLLGTGGHHGEAGEGEGEGEEVAPVGGGAAVV
jgi:hypothetical protein